MSFEEVPDEVEPCEHLHRDYIEADPSVGIRYGGAVCEDCGQDISTIVEDEWEAAREDAAERRYEARMGR